MSRRFQAALAALFGGVLILVSFGVSPPAPRAPAADGGKKEAPPRNPFGLTKVLAVHLTLTAKEYQALQPPAGFGFPGGPGQPPPKPKKGKRPSDRNLFGTEFPWVQGDLTVGGKEYKKVGLRYDGNATYFASAFDIKRPLRIDLDRHRRQDFRGLRTLFLHSGALDPSRNREALAYAVFRAAGVPAPRTAFAEVTLTVPKKYTKEYLGLYTVVEPVDERFLKDRFGTTKGVLMKPQRLRGLDYLGDDWEKYPGRYQPQSKPTKKEARRVIAFARLVDRAGDKEFRKEIGSYLDVDEFLRFLAANALLANVESFFALGYNYYLYLHPKTNRFVFIPGDLELALANFLMMGSAKQLMDLHLFHPYPGPNKLADRLLAIKEVRQKYRKILKDLTATCFTSKRLLKNLAAIEKATKEPKAKDAKAAAARRKKMGGFGFGPPPGAFGGPPALRTFVAKRTASVAAQLAGKSKGYLPRFSFGPPGGFGNRANTPVVNDKTIHDVVKAPKDFQVTLYGAPPKLGYPVALSATPTGELFVAVDEQGSLGRTPGGGKVLRCLDKKGTGKAGEIKVFAKMEHPRGLIALGRSVWVLHPPYLSVYHDTKGAGVADRHETLVTGLTTDMIDKRGGDHTTNGIRLGIDGWIYIAVGDYGIRKARGKDGSTITLRGGGVVRVRPDGTELEIFATGLRNPFDLAIDPYLNLFTRDNTNDGAGWDTRVSHLVQSAHYGYTQLYANFPDEIMPTLGSFGGGAGTGGLFLQDPSWPKKYRDTLYTGDWARSRVYRHPLKTHGATFDLKQEEFLTIPRPTGMDTDGNGRLYVASWMGGEASVYVGPRVGFVACLVPRKRKPAPPVDLKKATLQELVRRLAAPTAVTRLYSQRELLRRGRKAETTQALVKLASDARAPLYGRVAAVFTLKQLDDKDSHKPLLKLTADAAVREFALRALTDRRKELKGVDPRPFVAALADPSPRVRAQAVISLGRLNAVAAARAIIPLTTRPKGSKLPTKKPVHAQPDADRVLPHLAVRALVSLRAAEACLEALDGPHREGALRALRGMHTKKAALGLIKKLGTARSVELRRGILATLIRLYHREADYQGTWWGIRPDSTGPYYDGREWALSKRIGAVITRAAKDGDVKEAAFLRTQLTRHQVSLKGLPDDPKVTARDREDDKPIVVPKADPKNRNQIGNLSYEAVVRRALRAKGAADKGKALFRSQSCIACHTYADGQTPKGPHLVDIGKRYSAAELLESILKPSAKIAQGFETYTFITVKGRVFTGFVVTESAQKVEIRETTGVRRTLKQKDIDRRKRQTKSMMPEGLVDNLTPEQLADLVAYLQSLT
jgi:putative membrane-bound dehydrogenase-like protein